MKKAKRTTFLLTITAISVGMALACLALSFYSPFAKLSFLALSSICLLLPLLVGSIWGCAMGYIATALLSWAVAGDIVSIVPFALLFGLQPLVMGLTAKLGKRWYFIIPIKLVHFNLGLWGTVSLFGGWGTSITLYLSRLGWEANYWALAIVLSVLWIAFDWAMGWAQRWLARRLNRVIGKYAPAAGVQSNAPGDKQKDIFVVGDNPIQENNPSKGDNSIQEDDSTQDEPSDQE